MDAVPNSCTALIPHPILRPGVQNGLVPYRPPSTTFSLYDIPPAYGDPEGYEVTYNCSTEQYLDQGFLDEGRLKAPTDDIVPTAAPGQEGV